MRKLLFFLFMLVLSLPGQGKDIRILAIGNSFSEDAIEQYLYELALEGGDNLIIGNASLHFLEHECTISFANIVILI